MSDPKVEEIRARLVAATPGPWRMTTQGGIEPANYSGPGEVCDSVAGARNERDWVFIANAPTDIDYLLTKLDEVEKRERVLIAGVREALESWNAPTPRDPSGDEMAGILSRLLPPTEEPNLATSHPECNTFAWIGQSLSGCDNCGRPFWEHEFQFGVGDNAGKVQLITEREKASVKRRWAPRG